MITIGVAPFVFLFKWGDIDLINAIRQLCYKTQLPQKRPYILRWLPQADMPSSNGEDGK
jgi:hypothetical protein